MLGFHGCDKSVRDAVVNGENLVKSPNTYDWLGNGFYFWENNEERAFQWVQNLASNPKSKVTAPSVLGAVIDLGNCLDLMSSSSVTTLQLGYNFLKSSYEKTNTRMPENRNVGISTDLLLRPLDCAVIEKTHVQICVVNPNCIKGYSIPRGGADTTFRIP